MPDKLDINSKQLSKLNSALASKQMELLRKDIEYQRLRGIYKSYAQEAAESNNINTKLKNNLDTALNNMNRRAKQVLDNYDFDKFIEELNNGRTSTN